MRYSISGQEDREMEDDVYYQKRFFNKDLGKEITYSYNYKRLTRRARRKPLIYGMSDGKKVVRFYFLTILVAVVFFFLIMVPVSFEITFIRYYFGIGDHDLLYDLISFVISFVFLFISYAVLMPRMIDIKIFRMIMDKVLLGRLKRKSA